MRQPDFEVIQRVLAGETAAFDALVRRYQEEIYRLAYRMTSNKEDAKDLAQETFVSAYRSLGTFRGTGAMNQRLMALLGVLVLWTVAPCLARGQAPAPGEVLRGLELLTPDERARVQSDLERWRQLPPEERQRIHDNLRRWREMTSEERQRIREEFRGRREGGAIRPRPGKGGGAPHSSGLPAPQSR